MCRSISIRISVKCYLIDAIFSEFLDERFVKAKSNCIFIFTFLQDVTLRGKIPERFILGVSMPGIWSRLPAMCPGVGWLLWSVTSVLELVFLAKVVLRFGRICTRHSRPRFPEKIPSALKGKFSSSTSYLKAKICDSAREIIIPAIVFWWTE